MSTLDQNHFNPGNEHTPEVGYLPGETYPNYLLGHDAGNGTVDTGLADQAYDRDFQEEYLHPFEVSVTKGNLYVAPGTVAIRGFDNEKDQMVPMYPTLGGTPIGPLSDNGMVSIGVNSSITRLVIKVSADGGGELLAWTNSEYSEHMQDEDETGFLVVVALLDLNSMFVTTGFTATGNPINTSSLEATFITQLVHSDVFLNLEILPDSGSGASGASDDGGSGSSKDSAIVPVNWTKTGFTALYCVEAPDVRFEDTIVVERPKWARNWSVTTCGRFRSVLEDGSMEVVAYTSDKPVPVGFSIDEHGVLTIRTSYFPYNRPNRLVVKLAGIRRGFAGVKFEEKTQAEFDANEKRLTLDL